MTKDLLFTEILKAVKASNGKVTIAGTEMSIKVSQH
jgi:hypothetical protein